MNYRTPLAQIKLNDNPFKEVMSIDVQAFRNQFMNTAKVELSNVLGDWPEVTDGDKVLLKAGYADEELWPVFTGSVKHADNQETIRLFCQCNNRQLVDNRFTRTYHKEEVSAIVSHLISECDYPAKYIPELRTKQFILPNVDFTIKDAIESLQDGTGLKHCCYTDPEGNFYWNLEEDLSGDSLVISEDDVFNFTPLPFGIHTLEMFGVNAWHSQFITKSDKDYLIMGVRHTIGGEAGFRSKLWLKEVERV